MKYINLFVRDYFDPDELDESIKKFEISEQKFRSFLDSEIGFEFLNKKELKFISNYEDLEYSGGKYGGIETFYFDDNDEMYYDMPVTKIIIENYFDILIYKKDDYYYIAIDYDQDYSSTFYDYFKLDQLSEFKFFIDFYLKLGNENE